MHPSHWYRVNEDDDEPFSMLFVSNFCGVVDVEDEDEDDEEQVDKDDDNGVVIVVGIFINLRLILFGVKFCCLFLIDEDEEDDGEVDIFEELCVEHDDMAESDVNVEYLVAIGDNVGDRL